MSQHVHRWRTAHWPCCGACSSAKGIDCNGQAPALGSGSRRLLTLVNSSTGSSSPLQELIAELPGVRAHMHAICVDGLEARTHAVMQLQADLATRRWLAVPLVLSDAVTVLEAYACIGQSMLSRSSLLALALLAVLPPLPPLPPNNKGNV